MNEQWVDEAINLAWGLRYNEIADATALRAHLSTPPQGFVLVPVEPTEAMVDAAYKAGASYSDFDIESGYRAMLAAAKEKA